MRPAARKHGPEFAARCANMPPMKPLATLVLIASAALLGGCLTTRSDSPRVETTSDSERDSIKGAAEAPLRDVNLLRTKIPEVLLYAEADPYSRPPTGWKCKDLIEM